MKSFLIFLFGFLLVATGPAESPRWTLAQIERLVEWLTAAEDDGLTSVAAAAPVVRHAIDAGNPAELDRVATAAAIGLLNGHRSGCCTARRADWHIAENWPWPDASEAVATAVAADRIDELFGYARPSHPFYYALRQAFAQESDAANKSMLAANLERWRWMPRDLGRRYLLVNTAAYEATLWDNGHVIGRWKVIVGKTRSPTPVFAASITGVTFNPWWEIPASIAAEGIGAMVRTHPAQAARKGYVLQNGRFRQQPGPNNALGQMKLVMPNAFTVYLHDTPNKNLFAEDVRTFSHGCIRVDDALGLATALLATQSGWDRNRVDGLVAARRTETVALSTAIPVYIAYFTVEPDGAGGIRYLPDIYHRDF